MPFAEFRMLAPLTDYVPIRDGHCTKGIKPCVENFSFQRTSSFYLINTLLALTTSCSSLSSSLLLLQLSLSLPLVRPLPTFPPVPPPTLAKVSIDDTLPGCIVRANISSGTWYFSDGFGACGDPITSSEFVVAVGAGLYDSQS